MVIFDFSKTTRMDDSAALVMEQLIDTANDDDTECIVMSLSDSVGRNLNALNVFRKVPKERFVENLDEARDLARTLLTNQPPSQGSYGIFDDGSGFLVVRSRRETDGSAEAYLDTAAFEQREPWLAYPSCGRADEEAPLECSLLRRRDRCRA